jgi:hypothetical protein
MSFSGRRRQAALACSDLPLDWAKVQDAWSDGQLLKIKHIASY